MAAVVVLILQGIYWLALFAWLRAFFLALNFPQIQSASFSSIDLLAGFWHALPLDLSTAAWFLVVPWLFATGHSILPTRFLNGAQKAWVLLLSAVYCGIALGEAAVYPEWKTKLTYRALSALRNPMELLAVTSIGHIVFLLLLFGVTVGGGFYCYQRFFYREFPAAQGMKKLPLLSALMLSTIALGWFARGGFSAIPISLSRVYYSTESLLNDAAVNPVWHFGFNVAASTAFLSDENPFSFMDSEEAQSIVDALHQRPSLGTKGRETILQPRDHVPNVVVIVLESWSADLIASLGGDPNLTPEFKKLENEGVLFTNFYANGNRSQQGIASIFSGFPALPLVAVTDNPAKTNKLPRLAEKFAQENYATSFLYGGQLEYGNIGAFLKYNGFQTVLEGSHFPNSLPRGNMGIHDQYMFAEHIKFLNQEKKPFFSALFSLSTHSPYDFPNKDAFKWEGPLEQDYVMSGRYTDKCLGDYFESARNQPWFKDTVFVIVADHSHNSYRNWPNWRPQYRKIPMLLAGAPLKTEWRGRKYDRISSHVDLPATILGLIGKNSSEFTWSKDLFARGAPEFAYYELNYGFGWITRQGEIVYDKELGAPRVSTVAKKKVDQATRQGMAYTQSVFQEFLDL